MIWLSNSTLQRLRDQLKKRGQRASVAMPSPEPGAPPPSAADTEAMFALAEYGPLCEAMYLMMSADGEVTDDERQVLRGALRNLSDDQLRTAQIDSLLATASRNVEEQGRDARMKDVILALHEDQARAEVAFVLAAAIAFADNAIADQENETLNSFAEGLGIDEATANQLLDSVEADLAKGREAGAGS
jgi:tellurite resistance protein